MLVWFGCVGVLRSHEFNLYTTYQMLYKDEGHIGQIKYFISAFTSTFGPD